MTLSGKVDNYINIIFVKNYFYIFKILNVDVFEKIAFETEYILYIVKVSKVTCIG